MTPIRTRRREWMIVLAWFIGMSFQTAKAQVINEVLWQHCFGGSEWDYGFRVLQANDGSIVCIGYGASANGDMAGAHGGDDILVTKLSPDGIEQWTRVLGGSNTEWAFDGVIASDGSIMVAGLTYSTDGDVAFNHGTSDVWIMKLSPLGALIWERTYGGSLTESFGQILEMPDGGFLVHANTESADGDVVGYHGGTGMDSWIFKIDPDGEIEWSRAVGGSGHEGGAQMFPMADGGVLLNFSFTESGDGDLSNYHGTRDCGLVKMSASGNVEWARLIGGSLEELGGSAVEMPNGDILMVGSTSSSDGDIPLNQGTSDVLLARLSGSGDLLWVRTYGGSLGDGGYSLYAAADGGACIGAVSGSNDGDASTNHGGSDAWVFKVDDTGDIVWEHSYGGAFIDLTRLYEDNSGGYVLFGSTEGYDPEGLDLFGARDFWLVKLTPDGDMRWQRPLGGTAHDEPKTMVQTSDSTFVALGFTESNDGDVSGNHGQRDMWVVKLKVTEPVEPPECALYIPNAISPDNNTKNDLHCLYGTDCIKTMTMGIFDRWGNKVFESTDPSVCWDGNFNGQPLDPAVFVYHLSATMNNGETVERQGNISLLK